MIPSNFGSVIGIFLACASGFPVPEEITLLTTGVLVATKQLAIGLALLSCWSGLLMSDWTLFFLGRHLGIRVFRSPLLRNVLTESRVRWAETLIQKNSHMVCFLGRFVPGLRVVLFTMIGVLGIKPRVFLVIDTLAALISVSLWIFFGSWMASHFINATRYTHEIRIALAATAILIAMTNIVLRLITWVPEYHNDKTY